MTVARIVIVTHAICVTVDAFVTQPFMGKKEDNYKNHCTDSLHLGHLTEENALILVSVCTLWGF